MVYKTNYIDVKTQKFNVHLQVEQKNGYTTTDNDGLRDKFLVVQIPRFNKWEIEATVTTHRHMVPFNKKRFEYNGLDIQVGDWVALQVLVVE